MTTAAEALATLNATVGHTTVTEPALDGAALDNARRIEQAAEDGPWPMSGTDCDWRCGAEENRTTRQGRWFEW